MSEKRIKVALLFFTSMTTIDLKFHSPALVVSNEDEYSDFENTEEEVDDESFDDVDDDNDFVDDSEDDVEENEEEELEDVPDSEEDENY